MRTKIDSKKKIDLNFKEVIKIFKKNNIHYWLCHGTLLGIIRDKRLIPWDHDVDIAVWNSKKLNLKIRKLICEKNFILKKKFYKNDGFLTFIRPGGREIDINFYNKKKFSDKHIAYVKWYAPKNLLCKLIEALSAGKNYKGKLSSFIRTFSFIDFIFIFLKRKLIEKKLFFKGTGYTQPVDLLKNFKTIKFQGISVNIPKRYNEYLNFVYGKNWKKPIKNFNYRESPSLRDV